MQATHAPGAVLDDLDETLRINAETSARTAALQLAGDADRIFAQLLAGGPVSDDELRAGRRLTLDAGAWAYQAGWTTFTPASPPAAPDSHPRFTLHLTAAQLSALRIAAMHYIDLGTTPPDDPEFRREWEYRRKVLAYGDSRATDSPLVVALYDTQWAGPQAPAELPHGDVPVGEEAALLHIAGEYARARTVVTTPATEVEP